MICFPPLQILRRGEEARKQAAGNNQSRRIYKSLKFAVKITVFETTHKCRIILLKVKIVPAKILRIGVSIVELQYVLQHRPNTRDLPNIR